MIKAAIFDLDGVLLQGRFFSDRFEEKYGVPAEKVVEVLKGEIISAKSQNIPTFPIWQRYLNEWGIELSEKEFFDFWFQGDTLNEEVLAIAKSVASKVEHIVILSDNFKERIEWLKRAFSFWDIFEKVYFSSEIGYSKDSKEAFQLVLDEFNLTAQEVFYTDDSGSAINVAKELGIVAEKFEGVDKLREDLRRNDIEA